MTKYLVKSKKAPLALPYVADSMVDAELFLRNHIASINWKNKKEIRKMSDYIIIESEEER
jgi:hypothetical protein